MILPVERASTACILANINGGDPITVPVALTVGAPEPSTWTMTALGFAGLGFAGYRASRKTAAVAA